MFVKICGLCRPEDVQATAALRPDAVGFVFWPRSPRAVSADQVAEWTRDWPAGIRKAGVFVDTPPDDVRRIADQVRLDILQLHGRQDPAAYRDLQADLWKVVHLDRTDPRPPDGCPVDAFLIDSYSATSPGGTGIAGDWRAAAAFTAAAPRPVVLAGGLTPDNIGEAIRTVGPWGVDVSSGVETAPGRKDIKRIEAFIQLCRTQ